MVPQSYAGGTSRVGESVSRFRRGSWRN